MSEVDPFSMIDELPERQPDVIQELPFRWARFGLGLAVGMLIMPWMLGVLSAATHYVGLAFGAYCDWAYHLAGGR